MNSKTREYLFFALGLLGAVWFFVGYPSQDPRSLIDVSKAKVKTIEQNALDKLESFGYNNADYKLETRLYSNRPFLDSLQKKMGRSQMIAHFKQKNKPNQVLFYWEVVFHSVNVKEDEIVVETGKAESNDPGQKDLKMYFSHSGDFLELKNPEEAIHPIVVNRQAIAASFGAKKDSAVSLMSAYLDTAITQSLLIDLQQNWQRSNRKEERLSQLKTALQSKNVYRLTTEDVFGMASHYLEQTGWNMDGLVQDTVQLGRVDGINTATARFHIANPDLQQQLVLDVNLTSTGAVLGIESSYKLGKFMVDEGNGIWSVIKDALIPLFILGGIILFFFRIRARAIDTKPALVVSILTGLAISILVLLFLIPKAVFISDADSWAPSIELLVAAGLAGAGSSLAFFMFFALGDSITRQHWPQKLNMYDYLRQGMIFNKPIGFVMVRSVSLAFALAGVWTLLLWVWPQLYLDINHEIFISQQAALPSVFAMLSNGTFSFSIVLGIFLVLGGQTLAQTKNKIVASAFMILACGVVVPYCGYLGPPFYQFIAGIILGAAMLCIYFQWDFLTLLLSHFLFLGLMATTTGWIIEGSIDAYLFIGALMLMTILLAGGLVAIGQGKEEKVLSRYVPQYVEELAQEERIKQELEIAREVQRSFLPVETPQFKGLELAAICKPAYETGGDYYDFVQLDENRVAVAIGDVS